ncbi:hypothetical protein CABS01_17126 [Colletotrichum abscissum]|uniref:uncharacterized protein n=1 Tax=Colletotrichum abscissum TaxID=1671311 RepID=UPI0027D74393|nr:uncharacterized protein CABS01_17126 [Colletotrichum abscissum]KAK1490918.1 hypothetical protein CABS01_17126 [Colletotrichum abscissum]
MKPHDLMAPVAHTVRKGADKIICMLNAASASHLKSGDTNTDKRHTDLWRFAKDWWNHIGWHQKPKQPSDSHGRSMHMLQAAPPPWPPTADAATPVRERFFPSPSPPTPPSHDAFRPKSDCDASRH